MASPLTLTRVWRILKEVDLEAIRREAGRRVRILVIGEDTADADSLAIRLAEGGGDPTRWLTAIDAPLAAPTVGAAGAVGAEPVVDGPDVVSHGPPEHRPVGCDEGRPATLGRPQGPPADGGPRRRPGGRQRHHGGRHGTRRRQQAR